MAPKRKAAPSTPTSKKSSKKGQTSIDTFFASPSKVVKRDTSVISIQDSDSDTEDYNIEVKSPAASNTSVRPNGHQVEVKGELKVDQDEELARSLQGKFDREDKGKGRATPIEEIGDEDDGIEIVKEEVRVKEEGINGSSSSKIHPMFSSPRKNGDTAPSVKDGRDLPVRSQKVDGTDSKAGIFDSTSKEITSNSAETVEAIDFDVDQFLFRPGEVDVSKWPKGRLPYSVLVGVYIQVSSTRSRLLIVRVLTK